MGRRKTSAGEDIFALVSAAPWWLGVVLAAMALIVLQLVSGMEVRAPAGAKGAGSFAILQLVKTGASLLRWFLPPLLLVAAGTSFLKQRRSAEMTGDTAPIAAWCLRERRARAPTRVGMRRSANDASHDSRRGQALASGLSSG